MNYFQDISISASNIMLNLTDLKKDEETDKEAWKRCADDLDCSKTCIRNYIAKYKRLCNGYSGCEQMARLYHGGPNGCKSERNNQYWATIQSCTA